MCNPCKYIAVAVVFIAAATGCNTARYGPRYNERLPQIQQIAIVPMSVSVQSRHSGGALEGRPQLSDETRARLVGLVQALIGQSEHGANSIVIPTTDENHLLSEPQKVALAAAIHEAVLTHHYQFGNDRLIDYSVGSTASGTAGEASDAILKVNLVAVVPTKARMGLAVTAAVVGALVGVSIAVPTHSATLDLMLIDGETGDVLWFNHTPSGTNVESDRGLKALVQKAGRHLLKPMKE